MIDENKIDLVARMGGNFYCRASGNALFTVEKPNLKLGIGIDAIPEKIRNSDVLSGNDLGKLGNIEKLPSTEEIDQFAQQDEVKKLKEALNNVVKHSGASSVDIKFNVNSRLNIFVHDNGKGFTVNNKNLHGNGLLNMQRRVQKLKGEMEILNHQGTKVVFDIPIKNLNS